MCDTTCEFYDDANYMLLHTGGFANSVPVCFAAFVFMRGLPYAAMSAIYLVSPIYDITV